MNFRALVLGIVVVLMPALPLRAQAVADSASRFYPLAVGNVWQYIFRMVTLASGGTPYTVKVMGDTVMPNGLRYYHVVEFPSSPFPPRYPIGAFGYVRYDSASGSILAYDLGSERDADIGLRLRSWIDSSLTYGTVLRRDLLFGDSVDILSAFRMGSYGSGIGPLGGDFEDCENDPVSIRCEHHELVYAKIGGREYGQFLSAPALEPEPTVSLGACSPNPFGASTSIGFTLPRRSDVLIDVVNEAGMRVATLVAGEFDAGSHLATLDGAGLPGGLYIVRMRAGGVVLTRRVALVR